MSVTRKVRTARAFRRMLVLAASPLRALLSAGLWHERMGAGASGHVPPEAARQVDLGDPPRFKSPIRPSLEREHGLRKPLTCGGVNS